MVRSRRSLATRFLFTYAVAVVVVLGLLGFLVERTARHALLEELTDGMTQQGLAMADLVTLSDPQGFVDTVATGLEARVTLIADDGTVLGDSLSDPETMENHGSRPEIQAALAGRVGEARRVSASTGFEQLYIAVPAPDGAVLRLSLPAPTVERRVTGLRWRLSAIVGLASIVGIVIVSLVARRLAQPLRQLADAASAVAAGNLDVEVPRSSVEELDQLGRSVGAMAMELGARLTEVEGERRTLGTVLDALPQGTLLVDAEDVILYANQSVGGLIGPVPTRLEQLVPFRVQDMVRRARAEGTLVDVDIEHGRPTRILRVLVSPVEDGRVLVVVSDITDRRRLDDVRRDFVTNASHELKTPVASILASAETLQIALAKAPERVPQFARQIEQAAKSLARMIADLLDLSRLEGRPADYGPMELADVVGSEVESLGELAGERGVTLRLEAAPVTVAGSAPDLGLAVRNLVDNALRYTEAGGEVVVSVGHRGGDATITVTDNGAGIPQRDLDRIFERFYRVDVARSRATGGTGLGLSIVRHVAESHGGSVAVQSQLGSGSTFTLSLPTGTGS